jgi:hypothetical protein
LLVQAPDLRQGGQHGSTDDIPHRLGVRSL